MFFRGEFAAAQRWAEKNWLHENDSGYRIAFVRLAIGIALTMQGQYEAGRVELEQTLIATRAVSSFGTEGSTLHWIGFLALLEKNYEQAQIAFGENLRLHELVQDDFTGFAIVGLGIVACYQQAWEQARHWFMRLLTLALKQKNFLSLQQALPGLVLYFAGTGQTTQAVTVWAKAQCYRYISNSKMYADLIAPVADAAAASLPTDIVTAAQVQGRSQDIWLLAETTLVDLK